MTFSEIKYERVDMEALKAELSALTERLANAGDFAEAEAAFLAANELEGRTVRTMRTVAQIRRDVDTRDEFYDAEMKFYNRGFLWSDWFRWIGYSAYCTYVVQQC